MPVSKAQIKATSKYESKNYDKILLRLPKGKRELVRAAAGSTGESLNGYITKAIDERMRKEESAE